MKYFLAIFGLLLAGCLAVSAAREYAESKEENEQLLWSSIDSCGKKYELSEDDVSGVIWAGDIRNAREECFTGCFLELVGVIDNGEYSLENSVEFGQKMDMNIIEDCTQCFKQGVDSKDICVIGPPLWKCITGDCYD